MENRDKFSDGKYREERLQHKMAFEYYYSLGEGRTIEAVAHEFRKKPRTIYEWSRRFNWTERIKQRDIEVGRQLEKRSIDTIIEEKAKYRHIIKLSIAKFVENLKDGKVEIKNVSALERLIKLDLLLMGEATDIQKVENKVNLTEEDKHTLEAFGQFVQTAMGEQYDKE